MKEPRSSHKGQKALTALAAGRHMCLHTTQGAACWNIPRIATCGERLARQLDLPCTSLSLSPPH